MTSRSTTLVGGWVGRRAHRAILCALVGSVLLALSARVEIPFWPVPFTMQTFVVLALGLVYGPMLGAATVLAYLGQGLMGLPVFAAGGGPAYLAGPTGGYLIGMVPAAWIAGQLALRGWLRHPLTGVLAAGIANTAVYAVGVCWLAVWMGGVEQAITAGLLPFLPGAVMKITGAGLIGWAMTRVGRKT
ncbi:biotin transporter BioY [Spiribacter pallidus]|jgi:biotin transport system substrate-specific component|uniref:Biotin transporter n=1 Tax=Spiribacter pallidus TaxID=1987936 RepID=A0ABV3T9C3_9GAMM